MWNTKPIRVILSYAPIPKKHLPSGRQSTSPLAGGRALNSAREIFSGIYPKSHAEESQTPSNYVLPHRHLHKHKSIVFPWLPTVPFHLTKSSSKNSLLEKTPKFSTPRRVKLGPTEPKQDSTQTWKWLKNKQGLNGELIRNSSIFNTRDIQESCPIVKPNGPEGHYAWNRKRGNQRIESKMHFLA